ncbi:spore germination protein [Paenibacillus sp. BC26]|uniref:spore germination protein n=1 Tax=Paenibacillus sp. BC26 TaxID=1881032 RepID=UPI0015A562FD|nr:spore germination protein [Paenibacillus sp. BC26]
MANHVALPTSADLESNIRGLTDVFNAPGDIYGREFRLQEIKGCILYHIAYTDRERLQNSVLSPLQRATETRLEDVLPILDLKRVTDFHSAAEGMKQGKCAIMLDQSNEIMLADVSIQLTDHAAEPQNEQTIRGSHDGFVDDLATNSQLIRKRLTAADLVERNYVLGAKSSLSVSLLYLQEMADPNVVEQIAAKIAGISVDFVKSAGQITELLESSTLSFFPQTIFSERPDTTVSHLMDGRVVVLIDGNAMAVILPVTFFMFFQVPDDYVSRWWNGTFFRFLRYISMILTVALPSIYIAIVSNHFEVLPIDLVFSLKASLENIPFDPLIEALFMIIVLELLREAALRLPKSIASTLSIVGGLVIGTEVVNANLVSTTMIVVIALTAVASFSLPSQEMRLALRLVSIPVMFASAMLGFVGIALSFSLLFMHLTKLESFGVPYFYPFAPLEPRRLLPALIQLPVRMFGKKTSKQE